VDDGLRAGLFSIEELKSTPLAEMIIDEVDSLHPNLEIPRRHAEVARRFITRLVEDVIFESGCRLQKLKGEGADAVRKAKAPVVAFSAGMEKLERELKEFLRQHMYRHKRVLDVMKRAENATARLFDIYIKDLNKLPPEWLDGIDRASLPRAARCVCDFIAGMTDRFALAELQRLTDTEPDLRI
jgi:dGTPase